MHLLGKTHLVAMVLALVAGSAQAQQLQPRAQPIRYSLTGSQTASSVLAMAPATVQQSHWLEGGLIGAAIGGGAGLLFGALCNGDSGGGHCGSVQVSLAIGGAAAGFVIGALIGGQSPKH